MSSNSTFTHIYGITSLVPSVVSIVVLVRKDAPWQEYALVGSGWIAALFFAAILLRAFSQAKADSFEIGRLNEKIKGLEDNLDQRDTVLSERIKSLEHDLQNRNAILEYVASHQMGQRAMPRAAPDVAPNGEDQT